MQSADHRSRLLLVSNQVRDFLDYRIPLACALRDAGFEVCVVVPEEPGLESTAFGELEVDTVDLSRLSLSPWQELRTLACFLRLYRKRRPAVVHHMCLKPVLYGGIAARVLGIPCAISTLTGLGPVFTGTTLKMRILRRLVSVGLRFAFGHPNHLLVVQNPDDRDLLVALRVAGAERTVVVAGSGIDLARFRPTSEPPGPPVVLMVSRLLWDKGVGEYVAVARELRRRGRRARFVFAGEVEDGHPHSVPRATLEAWRHAGDVEWLGWQEDVPSLIAQSHIVCLPSYYGEGIPRILMEAAASGRPVITTDSPGCRHAVDHGNTGLLVAARDVEALTAALVEVLDHPDTRAEMGRRGRELAAARFAQERVLDTTLMIHRALVSASPSAPDRSRACLGRGFLGRRFGGGRRATRWGEGLRSPDQVDGRGRDRTS
jgi:glycosyltransferase involved in cell wall biosynthesis